MIFASRAFPAQIRKAQRKSRLDNRRDKKKENCRRYFLAIYRTVMRLIYVVIENNLASSNVSARERTTSPSRRSRHFFNDGISREVDGGLVSARKLFRIELSESSVLTNPEPLARHKFGPGNCSPERMSYSFRARLLHVPRLSTPLTSASRCER